MVMYWCLWKLQGEGVENGRAWSFCQIFVNLLVCRCGKFIEAMIGTFKIKPAISGGEFV